MKTEKKPIVLIAIDREPAALHVIEEGIRVASSQPRISRESIEDSSIVDPWL